MFKDWDLKTENQALENHDTSKMSDIYREIKQILNRLVGNENNPRLRLVLTKINADAIW